MSFKDLMTYKRILIRHIYTSVISWWMFENVWSAQSTVWSPNNDLWNLRTDNPQGKYKKLKSVSPSSLFPDRLLVQFRIPSRFVFLPASTPSPWTWHSSRAVLRPGEGDRPGEKMTRKERQYLRHRGLMEVQRHREQEPPPLQPM